MLHFSVSCQASMSAPKSKLQISVTQSASASGQIASAFFSNSNHARTCNFAQLMLSISAAQSLVIAHAAVETCKSRESAIKRDMQNTAIA